MSSSWFHGDSRRSGLRIRDVLGLLLPAVMLVASCGGQAPAKSASGEPIRIGMVDAASGSYGFIGQSFMAGMQVGISEINASGGVLGRPINVVLQDDQLTGPGAVQALRRLSSQGINLFIGGSTTPECQAMIPILQELNAVLLGSACALDNLTGTGVNPLFFRWDSTDTISSTAMAKAICKQFPTVKRMDTLSFNYVTGVDSMHRLEAAVKSTCNIQTGTEVLAPLNVTSVTSYLNQVIAHRSSDASTDSVLNFGFFGPSVVSAAKEGTPIGLFTGYKAVVDLAGAAFPVSADTLKPDVPPIYTIATYYDNGYHTGVNDKFVKDFASANKGAVPEVDHGLGYNYLLAMVAAIRKANSTDPAKVAKAFAGLAYNGTQPNQVHIDATSHQGNPQLFLVYWNGAGSKLSEVVTP